MLALELVQTSVPDRGSQLASHVVGCNDGTKLSLGELDGAHESEQKLPGVSLHWLSPTSDEKQINFASIFE